MSDGGRADLLAILATVLPQIKAGTLKPMRSPPRPDALPDVPTVAESGFPDYDASQWFSVAASPGLIHCKLEC